MQQLKNLVVIGLIFILPTFVACSSGSGEETTSDSNNSGEPNTPDNSVDGLYHQQGFDAPDVHGPALTKGELDCRGCHGSNLQGNIGPSCDNCHGGGGESGSAWRSDCAFCHGGTTDESGAPPKYLSGDEEPGDRFPAHEAHISSSITQNLSCDQCHQKVNDVLSPKHMFDSTPGVAEVDMANGFSPQGEFEKGVGCANSYCHSGGRNDISNIAQTETNLGCSGCHAGANSGAERWQQMSGFHNLHLSSNNLNMSCRDCHQDVTEDNNSIANLKLHINNQRDISFSDEQLNFSSEGLTCSGSCHDKAHPGYSWVNRGNGEGYHPEGFAAPNQHGVEMVLQRSDCRSCHGTDLNGGIGNSCDDCHGGGNNNAWRTDCTFCHGGGENSSGAPPHDLGTLEGSLAQSFTAHTAHVEDGIAAGMACNQCHNQPEDVLSTNHAFDNTPGGEAELNFAQSLGATTTYSENSCGNSYCHGNGQGNNGSVLDGETMACDSCHASNESGENAWAVMSGFHALHLADPTMSCSDCHNQVTSNNTAIVDIGLHVNGEKNVAFSENSITYNEETLSCEGSCHGRDHSAYGWGGGVGAFHPEGFADPAQHGVEMMLQTQNCSSCHGEDLSGGIGNSCDECHGPNGGEDIAWRSNCSFCHGGTEDESGAPPKYLSGDNTPADNAFPAHQAHVNSSITQNLDCEQCHIKVEDVLTPGHAFDSTPGEAEVDMANGFSPQAEFTKGVGCANSYCHGGGRNDAGNIAQSDTDLQCNSCHPDVNSGANSWLEMSGFHNLHLSSGIEVMTCRDCHNAVTADNSTIANLSLHINDQRDIAFSEITLNFDAANQTCNGSCHGRNHPNYGWAGGGNGGFHPEGFAEPEQHGVEMVLQRSDCRSCHGNDLSGGVNPAGDSCDNCHGPNGSPGPAWRSDCTFCHGGIDNNTGAPPHDLGVLNNGLAQSFEGHTAHVEDGMAAAMTCSECHSEPSDVLSLNHAFDDSPGGEAELNFSQSLSQATTYNNNSCSNSYCHGNGQEDNGSVTDGEVMTCDSCHADSTSSPEAWSQMSGFHRLHLNDPTMSCSDCHNQVTANNIAISNIQLHVNGEKEVAFSEATLAFDAANISCNGSCHGRNHPNYGWGGGGGNGSFHPDGFVDPSQHGLEMVLQTQNCTSCHGEDLTGGIGNSCDECHGPGGGFGTAWRSDCTFCHGGTDNASGAPPHDLDGSNNNLSFAAHTAHIESTMSSPLDCVQCHVEPSDVLSSNHAFDNSPGGVAETNFTRGLSPATVFNSNTNTCSNSYCHGNGQADNGIVSDGETMTCNSCHQENRLGGEHGEHRGGGIDCGDCHLDVSINGQSLINVDLHINKRRDIRLRENSIRFNANNRSCSGPCHGEGHNGERW